VPTLGGGSDFGAEWNLAASSGKPSLVKELLLLHRAPAIDALDRVAAGTSDQVGLQTKFPREVVSFVAAYLAERALLNSPASQNWLIVRDHESWIRAAASTDTQFVLVAHPNLQFESNRAEFSKLARVHGHRVVFPTLTGRSDDKSIVPLGEPSRHEVAEVLKKHQMPEIQAEQLATRSNGNLPLLLRYLTNTPETPTWSSEEQARVVRPLALLAGWRTDFAADKLRKQVRWAVSQFEKM